MTKTGQLIKKKQSLSQNHRIVLVGRDQHPAIAGYLEKWERYAGKHPDKF